MELIQCRPIGGLSIRRDDTCRSLLVGEESIITCTPTEYRLLLLLLQESSAKDTNLIASTFACEIDALSRKNLERHVDNLKSKLRPSGLYIRRIHKYGYMLVQDTTKDTTVPA